ncbi:unnamed protein product [Caenorhabditis sp. 36 PRJEB53466]|nr:unnamed protein product [Caenorhabditis sp. 36 PRJEB53466]
MSSGSSSSSTNDSAPDSVTPTSETFQSLALTTPSSATAHMPYFGFQTQQYTNDFSSYTPSAATYAAPYPLATHSQLANFNRFGPTNQLSLSGLASQQNLMINGIGRRKRRVLFSPQQVNVLENKFRSNRYLSAADRESLARSINLTPTQVKIWFQNQRYKHKRQEKEKKMDGGRYPDTDRDSDSDGGNGSHGSLACSPVLIKKEDDDERKPAYIGTTVPVDNTACLPDIPPQTFPYQVYPANGYMPQFFAYPTPPSSYTQQPYLHQFQAL